MRRDSTAEREGRKGVLCNSCDTFTPFPAYVAAHSRELLDFTCACGALHEVTMMHATQRTGRKASAESKRAGR